MDSSIFFIAPLLGYLSSGILKFLINSYKKDRLSKTIAMTAITDFLFYGFASNSNIAQTILSKGMETLNKSKLKNIFSKLAAK